MYPDKPGISISGGGGGGGGGGNSRARLLGWPPVMETLDLDDLMKKQWTVNSNDNTLQVKHPRTLATRSNHPYAPFSSIYPNLVFIIVSLNFQTSRSSYSKLRKTVFFIKKKSTLLKMRRQKYENLPKAL